jgi:hypothetical protein
MEPINKAIAIVRQLISNHCNQTMHLQITDYKMAPKGAPVNGANLGSMGFKLSTKLINKLIIIR